MKRTADAAKHYCLPVEASLLCVALASIQFFLFVFTSRGINTTGITKQGI